MNNSYFDGGLLQLIGYRILGFLVTFLTLGICAPWAICLVYNWETKHTVINGQRLHFNGTAVGLFGNWIKWLLLTIVTLGIYSFWLSIALKKWKTKHTHFM
jgi:Predicted membrane protein